MSEFTLVIGSKSRSSWSLRGWLAAKASGAPFEELVIPLDRPQTAAAIRVHSPAGRVPILKCDGLVIWDSLAIAEFLAERYPEARLWPADAVRRARARAVAAEMHAGFAALRDELSFDTKLDGAGAELGAEARTDLDRIFAIWAACRSEHGELGPYLMGAYSLADVFYAPVVLRLRQYGIAAEPAEYADTILARADVAQWLAAARQEEDG